MARRYVSLDRLPSALSIQEAVQIACADDIDWIADRLCAHQSVLVECDKQVVLYLYLALRGVLKHRNNGPKMVLIDGRPRNQDEAQLGTLRLMVTHLKDAIRGSIDHRAVVLPHLDVLTTTHSSLTVEAREVIPLLYENPEAVVLGFRDPSFAVPSVIEHAFAATRTVLGVPRALLPKLITRREARALSTEHFDPFALYKYVSGLNPVRLRTVLIPLAERREAMPGRTAQGAYQAIRTQTAGEAVELPEVHLDQDIGGYAEVKSRLRDDLIDLLARKDSLETADTIRELESLLPRGIIFHGPPGTGKTYFAKALAAAIDATILVVSGPELKSKWVGESELKLRQLFRTARASAPCVLVFDEIDAFATRRGTYTGSGVEHSMVNQLLTEMDGFRSNEMVFVVGTTNLLSSVDTALLRPGRFEFLIEVPAPSAIDREAIIRIYNTRFRLNLADPLIRHMVRRTAGLADRVQGLPFTGDHLYAVCRALRRQRLREDTQTFTTTDIDMALQRRTRRPIVLSPDEERCVAVHEAGHALLAMLIPGATPPERISIAADVDGALGYVITAARARPYAITRTELLAEVCVGLGGLVAEQLVLGDISVGAGSDLRQATTLAHAMVCEYGMSDVGLRAPIEGPESEMRLAQIDAAIDRILSAAQTRAQALLTKNVAMHAALVERLLDVKVLDISGIRGIING